MYIGDFNTGATVKVFWNTNGADGSSITRATDGTLRVYKGTSATQRTSLNGVTEVEDFDSLTGVHTISIDLSDNTDSGFYAAGNDYFLVYAAMTIDGKTVNHAIAQFSVENRNRKATDSSGNALMPLRAATIIRISAGGTVTHYTPATDTDADRGAAMVAAKGDAASGDMIYVYCNGTVTSTLAKDGVNWTFVGATVKSLTTVKLFTDGGSAMNYSIFGNGVLQSTSGNTIEQSNASSNIFVEAKKIQVTSGGSGGACVILDGNATINASESIEGKLSAITTSAKRVIANAPLIKAVTEAIDSGGNIGDAFITCDQLEVTGSTGQAIALENMRLNLKCKKIVTPSTGTAEAIHFGTGAQAVIDCPEILGRVDATCDGSSSARFIGSKIAPVQSDTDAMAVDEDVAVTLEGCTLKPTGTGKALTTATSSTVLVVGGLTYSGTVDAGVTLDYQIVRADNRDGDAIPDTASVGTGDASEATQLKILNAVQGAR